MHESLSLSLSLSLSVDFSFVRSYTSFLFFLCLFIPVMEKHSCRICGRSFPSGRSLGGHMRSHVVLGSSMASENKQGSGYRLRDNPIKSRRFNDSLERKGKICTNLGKPSSSEIPRDDSWSRECFEGEMQSQSSSEVTAISTPMRKQRWGRSRRISSSSSSSPLEYDKEQGDCALSLLMLSRCSGSFKVHSPPPESGFSIDDSKHGDLSSADLKFSKRTLSNQCDNESKMPIYSKNSRYECTNCSKCFHSYQALGGHRASHGKMKGECREFNKHDHGSQLAGRSPENPGAHECSICGNIFASGQALSGHKRSHFVAETESCILNEAEQKGSKLNWIDLNLPAADD